MLYPLLASSICGDRMTASSEGVLLFLAFGPISLFPFILGTTFPVELHPNATLLLRNQFLLHASRSAVLLSFGVSFSKGAAVRFFTIDFPGGQLSAVHAEMLSPPGKECSAFLPLLRFSLGLETCCLFSPFGEAQHVCLQAFERPDGDAGLVCSWFLPVW